jgi:hypothetical protein
MATTKAKVIIPDYDPYNPEPYPGNIKPYSDTEVKELLEKHKDNPEAIQFLQEMLEE